MIIFREKGSEANFFAIHFFTSTVTTYILCLNSTCHVYIVSKLTYMYKYTCTPTCYLSEGMIFFIKNRL